jgi:hypothetical protein
VEDYLPSGPDAQGLDPQILQVLEKGRPEDSRNDLTISPLTAYVYRCLGVANSATAFAHALDMARGALPPAQFLATLPPDMLGNVIDACAHIAISRRDKLVLLKTRLQQQSALGIDQNLAP